MKKMFILIMVFLLISICTSITLGEEKKIQQTYVNCTIVLDDYIKAQSKLQDIVSQYNGTMKNFSFDRKSNSGNASIQINPGKVSSFIKELGILGQVENTSFSSSDYTKDYLNYKEKLIIYRKMCGLYPKMLENLSLSEGDRALVQQEVSQYLTSQISSFESTIKNYEEYNKYTECSIQFRFVEGNNPPQVVEQQHQGEVKNVQTNTASPYLIPLYVLLAVNIVLTLYVYTRNKKSPYVS